MGQAMRKPLYDECEYLASESQAPVKREFVAGEVYAMAGGTARHNRISGNLYVKLDAAIRGTPCEVFMADMKVKVEAHRAFYYPDVLLACEPGDDEPLYRSSPCLIVEVLSPSTAGIDEREKWHHYRDIPTLRHYLLIDSESRQVRLRTREGADWLEQTLGEGERLRLTCGPVRLELGLEEIYDRSGLEVITQYVEREEKREAFRQDTLKAWEEYRTTGLHVTAAEADAWLAQLEQGKDIEPPECHV